MLRADQRYRFHGRIAPDRDRQPRAFLEPRVEGQSATIRLYDPIDSWGEYWGVSAKEFAGALDALPADVEQINLHINSPGGEVFEGLAILNLLRAHPANVVTIVDGIAASIASVIALAGNEVTMSPNSELMIHDAWGICIGNAADMASLGATLDHLSNNVASVYASKAGGPVADWRALMLAETWYGADEAVAAGLADSVVVPAEAQAKDAAFDLSIFTYAGRAAAPEPGAPIVAEPPAPVVEDRIPRDDRALRFAQQLAAAGISR